MSPRRALHLLRFARDRAAASAVEFALVAPLLFGLIFSSFELGWYMVQAVLLDHGLDRAIRDVRIGDAGSITHAGFKALVCEQAGYLSNCATDLIVEMIPVDDAGDFPANDAVCVDRGSTIAPVIRFTPGARSQVLFVRACLLVDPLVPRMGLGAQMYVDEDGVSRIVSTSAFVNEPD